MKALVKTAKGPGNIEVKDMPIPELPGDDWVRIKVKSAGVCGTDLHIWKDEFPYWPPVILGHEFAGDIVKAGDRVKNFRAGDRVVAEPHSMACGYCEYCRTGRIQICENKRSPGWGIHGAFTDYLVMPGNLLHRIPESLPYDVASLAEPLAIVIHQVGERVRVDCQDNIVVTGAGPMGILSVLVARELGAAKIAITGMNSCEHIRFDLARKMGADVIINVEKDNATEAVKEMTGGKGADLVIETSGAEAAIRQSVEMVKKCGRICAIGLAGKETTSFPWNKAMHKVLDIKFNFSSSYTAWDRALSLLASTKKDMASLITHRTSIENWERVFTDLIEEKGLKALFMPE